MKVDIAIKDGHVVDPSQNLNQVKTIYLKAGKVVEPPAGEVIEAGYELDATECYVIPGMIDYHEHINYNLTEVGIPADLATLPKGVTTVVDCGSSGPTNCLGFLERLKSLLVRTPVFIFTSVLWA